MSTNSPRYTAFTLAEVLIVLGIIGVIAALVLPGAITDIQKIETVSQLKKEFTTFNQALIQSEADNGPNSTWDWGSSSGPGLTINQSFNQYWAPYLGIVKTCSTLAECGYTSTWYRANKTTGWVCSSLYGALSYPGTLFLLKDGAVVYIRSYATYGDLELDINGSKGPNVLGHDLFQFSFSDGKLLPTGYGDSNPCPSGDNTGGGCGAKIIRSGWQIPADYQW